MSSFKVKINIGIVLNALMSPVEMELFGIKKELNMGIDGEFPAIRFLITSIGFVILSFIQYRNTGKSFNTVFLSIMAIISFLSYIILMIPR